VIQRVLRVSENLEVLEAVVEFVAVPVVDVVAVGNLDAGVVEDDAMRERVAVRARERMGFADPDPAVAVVVGFSGR
jgi:hypothetical protein